MRKVILLIVLIYTITTTAQDGSDIGYVKVSNLDNSYIGKLAHLDFYNRSFGGFNYDKKDLNDTVIIKLENKEIVFKEHRVDNGFNNWFSEQYIESIKFVDGHKIRISKCKIVEVKSDFIKVILFVEYRNKNGKLNFEKPNKIEYSFSKKIVTEILVKYQKH